MLHFDSLLSAKLCVDEQPRKTQEFKRCFRLFLLYVMNYTFIISESQLLIFLASKAFCKKIQWEIHCVDFLYQSLHYLPKIYVVGFAVIATRLPHLAISQESENLFIRKWDFQHRILLICIRLERHGSL